MTNRMILALALGASSFALAGEDRPALNVLVSDRVGVEVSGLQISIRVAQQILGDAGIPTNWSVCPAAGASSIACPSGTDRPDVSVRLLAKPVAGHQVGSAATGMALQGKPGAPASYAFVYHARILQLASSSGYSVHRLMGHVMAHEIGHLLGLDHSWQGIMSAKWGKDQARQMSAGYLVFQSDQVQTMLRNIQERAALR